MRGNMATNADLSRLETKIDALLVTVQEIKTCMAVHDSEEKALESKVEKLIHDIYGNGDKKGWSVMMTQLFNQVGNHERFIRDIQRLIWAIAVPVILALMFEVFWLIYTHPLKP